VLDTCGYNDGEGLCKKWEKICLYRRMEGDSECSICQLCRSPDRRLFLKVHHVDKISREIPTGAGHKSTASLTEVDLQRYISRYRDDIDKFKA
jgi:hypothetical protein